MSGFIYLWFDRKNKRFYLGKHWGTLDDGYVCSSPWMKRAKKRRPQDFKKRRVLQWVHTNQKDLGEAEKRWGSLIKKEELGKRYYNLKPPGGGHWAEDPGSRKTVSEKISASPLRNKRIGDALRGKTKPSAFKGKSHTPEAKSKIKEARAKQVFSLETKRKLSEVKRGKPRSEETKRKISETKRRQWQEKKI